MNDVSKQRLKRTIASALVNVDEMQRELAAIRAQCKLMQEEMKAIRVRSMRSRIHSVSPSDSMNKTLPIHKTNSAGKSS